MTIYQTQIGSDSCRVGSGFHIAVYKNGDFETSLYSNGYKERCGEGKAEFPESVDLKITDYCDLGCPFCHESSTKRGIHADKNFVKRFFNEISLDGKRRGIEIAIGGGNPLDHPDLQEILIHARICGLIPNITVNEAHVRQDKYAKLLYSLKYSGLLYGIGVSTFGYNPTALDHIGDVIAHVIIGKEDPRKRLFNADKILLLGYKNFGFGAKYLTNHEEEIARNITIWRAYLPIIAAKRMVFCDNLAIKQLDLQNAMLPDVWDTRFLGEDGCFSMYVDAVRQEYAKSSTSERHAIHGLNFNQAFKLAQKS